MNTKNLRRRVRALLGDSIIAPAPGRDPLLLIMPDNDDE
jgi:hypothetical protein